MQEAIDEQNRKEREIINKINQEKNNREAENNRNLQERKRLENEIIEKYRKINEERLDLENQSREGKINSSNQGKIKQLEKELDLKKQILEIHTRQSELKRNLAQQELFAYIEQRR